MPSMKRVLRWTSINAPLPIRKFAKLEDPYVSKCRQSDLAGGIFWGICRMRIFGWCLKVECSCWYVVCRIQFTVGIRKSECSVSFLTYQGAPVISLKTRFWNVCRRFIWVMEADPQIEQEYCQIGLSNITYMSFLLCRGSEEFSLMRNFNSCNLCLSLCSIFVTCFLHVRRESKIMPRYFTSVFWDTSWPKFTELFKRSLYIQVYCKINCFRWHSIVIYVIRIGSKILRLSWDFSGWSEAEVGISRRNRK